jgi:hypothetical protein
MKEFLGSKGLLFPLSEEHLPRRAIEILEIAKRYGNFGNATDSPVLEIAVDDRKNLRAFWPSFIGVRSYTNKGSRRFEATFESSISETELISASPKIIEGKGELDVLVLLQLLSKKDNWKVSLEFVAERFSKPPCSAGITDRDIYPSGEGICLCYPFVSSVFDKLQIADFGVRKGDSYAKVSGKPDFGPNSKEVPFRSFRAWKEQRSPGFKGPYNPEYTPGYGIIKQYNQMILAYFPNAGIPLEAQLERMTLEKMLQEVAPKILTAMIEFVEN